MKDEVCVLVVVNVAVATGSSSNSSAARNTARKPAACS